MEVLFTEMSREKHVHNTRVIADDGACHVMLRFLCDEAITRESDFGVKVIKK